MSGPELVPPKSPDFVQGICRAVDLSARTADVQLAASPSLLTDVPLARHVSSLAAGDLVLVLLPAPDRPEPDTLLVAVSGVGLPRPSFTLPIGHLAVTLSPAYQTVTENIQNISFPFTLLSGQVWSTDTPSWNLYLSLPLAFNTNPTTIRVRLWHYWGGSWQAHATTYIAAAYATGHNYRLFGPWPVSQVAVTHYFQAILDTGTGNTIDPLLANAAYLFRQD